MSSSESDSDGEIQVHLTSLEKADLRDGFQQKQPQKQNPHLQFGGNLEVSKNEDIISLQITKQILQSYNTVAETTIAKTQHKQRQQFSTEKNSQQQQQQDTISPNETLTVQCGTPMSVLLQNYIKKEIQSSIDCNNKRPASCFATTTYPHTREISKGRPPRRDKHFFLPCCPQTIFRENTLSLQTSQASILCSVCNTRYEKSSNQPTTRPTKQPVKKTQFFLPCWNHINTWEQIDPSITTGVILNCPTCDQKYKLIKTTPKSFQHVHQPKTGPTGGHRRYTPYTKNR
jgi:transcription elongation factor Elf1